MGRSRPRSSFRHFKPLCARLGIPTGALPDGRRGFRFHDLRHSTASIMAARGERPEVIQRVMRHAKVSFTLDRYGPRLAHQLATREGDDVSCASRSR